MARLQGDTGANSLNGGASDDLIFGGTGADTLSGGAGNDVLYGYGTGSAPANAPINATLVASGLSRPVFMTEANDGSGRAFVLEQHTGQIKVLDLATGTVAATPFLDIGGLLSIGGEQGLLGMALAPDFATSGRVFVNYTDVAGTSQIVEYTVSGSDPAVLDPNSARPILSVAQPFTNHNGGWLAFGPDGYLYIAFGDGGSAGDPGNRAENIDVLLGKILRIDVMGAAPGQPYLIPPDNPFVGAPGADEIWAYGLRNPWRPSFDSFLGDLWIADVGQRLREEINVQQAGAVGGANYGWNWFEGTNPFTTGTPPPGLLAPIHEYNHDATGGFSVTGGYVFRGGIAGLEGEYFFADFVTNQIWSLIEENGQLVRVVNRTAAITANAGDIDQIASFAQDQAGNLYIVGLDGEIHRLSMTEDRTDAGNFLSGGAGRDRLYGGTGDDVMNGGTEDDIVSGGDGADNLNGAAGNDTLNGDDGSDGLVGGAGVDRLFGGAGNDYLYIDAADSVISGGTGYDAVFIQDAASFTLNVGGAGVEWVYGWLGNNTLDASSAATSVALVGEAGSDVLVGSAFNDFIYFDGFDTVDAGNGYDAVFVYQGNGQGIINTTINVAAMNAEWALGGGGNDTLTNAARNVSVALSGGGGNDTLTGGLAGDFLYGNGGNDVFVVSSNAQTDFVLDMLNGQDVVDVRALGAAFDTFAELQAAASAYGSGSTILNFGSGNALVLFNFALTNLDSSDFIV